MDIEPAWPARIWFFIIPMPFYTGCWRLEFDVRVPYSTQYKKACCDQKDWILTALLVVHTIYTSCTNDFRAMLGSRPIKFIKWWSSIIHYLFGDSHADAEICALNLATFGVGTNIKSILLTLNLVWGDSLRLKLSPQWCLDVNGIDLIVVCTPKFPKVGGHFLATACESPNK